MLTPDDSVSSSILRHCWCPHQRSIILIIGLLKIFPFGEDTNRGPVFLVQSLALKSQESRLSFNQTLPGSACQTGVIRASELWKVFMGVPSVLTTPNQLIPIIFEDRIIKSDIEF